MKNRYDLPVLMQFMAKHSTDCTTQQIETFVRYFLEERTCLSLAREAGVSWRTYRQRIHTLRKKVKRYIRERRFRYDPTLRPRLDRRVHAEPPAVLPDQPARDLGLLLAGHDVGQPDSQAPRDREYGR